MSNSSYIDLLMSVAKGDKPNSETFLIEVVERVENDFCITKRYSSKIIARDIFIEGSAEEINVDPPEPMNKETVEQRN